MYWWCLVAQNTAAEIWANAWYFYSYISHHKMCNRSAIHAMTVELHYKLHSKLMPEICIVKKHWSGWTLLWVYV